MALLPANVRWKADNFNHLMEHPTVFYAVAISLAVLGDQTSLSLSLAWGYVGVRVIHSLVQVLLNHIKTRFALFFSVLTVVVWLAVSCGTVGVLKLHPKIRMP